MTQWSSDKPTAPGIYIYREAKRQHAVYSHVIFYEVTEADHGIAHGPPVHITSIEYLDPGKKKVAFKVAKQLWYGPVVDASEPLRDPTSQVKSITSPVVVRNTDNPNVEVTANPDGSLNVTTKEPGDDGDKSPPQA